jgi:predicted nucleic acid-binding Zn ribbon protein
MAEEKKCPMEGCNCAVPEGQEYCSDYCKEHQSHGGHECACGHAGCH